MRGGDAQGRLVQDKARSLDKALLYSYQAAVAILSDGREFRCLINPNKLTMEIDEKMLSIPFNDLCLTSGQVEEISVKVGDVITWKENNTHWIIFDQYLQERAYFRGGLRQCVHCLEIGGKKYWVYLRGPREKSISWRKFEDSIMNELNYTMEMIISATPEAKRFLQRFSIFTLDGKNWEVQGVDTTTSEGLITVYLKEYYTNEFADSDAVMQPIGYQYKIYSIADAQSLDKTNAFYQIIDTNGKVIESGYQHSTTPKNTFYAIALPEGLALGPHGNVDLLTWDSGNKCWVGADISIFTNDLELIIQSFKELGINEPNVPTDYTLWADLSSADFGTDYRFVIQADPEDPDSVINKILQGEIPMYQVVEVPEYTGQPLGGQEEAFPHIAGDTDIYPYDIKEYDIIGASGGQWIINNNLAKIVTQTETAVTIEVISGKSGKFSLIYRTEDDDIELKITILSL